MSYEDKFLFVIIIRNMYLNEELEMLVKFRKSHQICRLKFKTMAITKNYSKDRKKCKVTFTLPIEAAPNAKSVKVLGDFNNWNWEKAVTLKATKSEYRGQLELTAGKEYQFRYQIDELTWENDWAADGYVQSPFPGITNSVLVLENGAKATPRAKAATTRKKPVAKKKTTAPVAKVAKAAPVKRRTAKKAKDFTVIEGVGPKINGLLVEAGFKTFESLAKAKPAKLKEVLKNAGSRYTMHDPTTWPKQAKLAAAEKWEELKTLQDKLSGGRKAK